MPHELKGQLKAVCPPEMRDALRQAMAQDVDQGNVPRLQAWLKFILSTPMRFKCADSDDGDQLVSIFQTVVQQREDIGVKHENMRVSSLMRVFEVMDLKKQLEKIEGKKNKFDMAEYYKSIDFAESSEPVSVTFIETAQALANGAFNIPEVLEICIAFDQLPHNPMDSVYKYQEVAKAASKHRDDTIWAFQMLQDWWVRTDGKDMEHSSNNPRIPPGECRIVSICVLTMLSLATRAQALRTCQCSFPGASDRWTRQAQNRTNALAADDPKQF